MVRAIQMCYSKLWPEVSKSPLPVIDMVATEDLFDPIVSVSMTAMLQPISYGGIGGLAIGIISQIQGGSGQQIGPMAMPSVGSLPAGVSPGVPGIAPPDRKRLTALLAAAFRDPCACAAGSGTTTEMSTGSRGVSFRRQMPTIPLAENAFNLNVVATLPPPAYQIVTDKAPYDHYEVKTTTMFQSGIIQLPSTGVGSQKNKATVAKTSGFTSSLVTTWVAGRTGSPPQLPAYQSTDPNLVPVRGAVVSQSTVPSADGSALVFLVSGYYVHAILDPELWEMASVQPPFVSSLVNDGAKKSQGFWADLTASVQQGVTGANPFVPGESTNGEEPYNEFERVLGGKNAATGFPSGEIAFSEPPLGYSPSQLSQDLSTLDRFGGGGVFVPDPGASYPKSSVNP